MAERAWDVVVVGAGNAAFCAALAARETGASRAGARARAAEESGGNTRFTAGAIRFAYDGVDDLRGDHAGPDRGRDRTHRFRHLHRGPVLRRHGPGHAVPHRPRPVRAPGHAARFDDDAAGCAARACASRRSGAARPSRSTAGSSSGAASRSKPRAAARAWSTSDRRPSPRSTASRSATARAPSRSIDDGMRSPGVRVQAQRRASTRSRADVGGARLRRLRVQRRDGARAISARAGSSRRCAARRFNTGDGIRMALDIGAVAVRQLVRLPRRRLGPQRAGVRRPRASATTSRSTPIRSASWSTPTGERFVDEGADFRNYTYAKYGRVILEQPGQFAWQIFDAQGRCTCCATSTASSR